MPHFVTLAEHVSNIVFSVILTINSDAQKHMILIKVKGIVSSSIHVRHMFRCELDMKKSGHRFCLCRDDVTRTSVRTEKFRDVYQSQPFFFPYDPIDTLFVYQ